MKIGKENEENVENQHMDLLAYYPYYVYDNPLHFIPNFNKMNYFSPLVTEKHYIAEVQKAMKTIPVDPQTENQKIFLRTPFSYEPMSIPYFSKTLSISFDIIKDSYNPNTIKKTFQLFQFYINYAGALSSFFLLKCFIDVDLLYSTNKYQGDTKLICQVTVNNSVLKTIEYPFFPDLSTTNNFYQHLIYKEGNYTTLMSKTHLLLQIFWEKKTDIFKFKLKVNDSAEKNDELYIDTNSIKYQQKLMYCIFLKKSDIPLEDKFWIERNNEILRFFDFMIFKGWNTNKTSNSADVDPVERTIPFIQSDTPISLFNKDDISNYPFDRIQFDENDFTDPNKISSLKIENINIDYQTTNIKESPLTDYCIFETSFNKCMFCYGAYILDPMTNTCNLCQNYFVDFLKVCFTSSDLSDSVEKPVVNNNLSFFTKTFNNTFEYNIITSANEGENYMPDQYKKYPYFKSKNENSYSFFKIFLTNDESLNWRSLYYNLYFKNQKIQYADLLSCLKVFNNNSGSNVVTFGFSAVSNKVDNFNFENENLYNISIAKRSKYKNPPDLLDSLLNVTINSDSFKVSDAKIWETIENKISASSSTKIAPITMHPYVSKPNSRFIPNGIFYYDIYYENDIIPNRNSYYLIYDHMTFFGKCPSNCTECNQNGCLNCIEGYFKKDGLCYKCSSECKTCVSSSRSCSECAFNNSLFPDPNVFNCFEKKSNCDKQIENMCIYSTQPEPNICSENTFYNSDENKCISCDKYCMQCNDNGICLKCIDGFFLYDTKCFINSLNSIHQSKPGYFMDLVNSDKFQPCIEGCSSCENLNSCILCKRNYFIDNNQICNKCPSNCLECSDFNTCLFCHYHFILTNGKCSKKNSYLSNTSQSHNLIFENSSSYILKQVLYQENAENIDNCINPKNNGSSECLKCRIGYFIKNKICHKCPTGCLTCKNELFCFTCAINYILEIHSDDEQFCIMVIIY